MKEKAIFDLITAPWKTRVIFVAVRLKLFTLVSEKAKTLEELSEQCRTVPLLLKAILDVCISMDLLLYQKGKYKNSQLSEKYLVEGNPNYIGDLIQLQDDESGHWDKLIDLVLGRRERRSENDRYRTFIKGMNNLGRLGEAKALADAVNLSGCRQMVDAGGGSGLYSVFFCQKYPLLHSTILDRRETLGITREMVSTFPEKDRITLQEVDIMNDSYGKNFDIVLLSDVIYDKTAAKVVLAKARDCLGEKGVLVIRGYYSDPENAKPLFGALFAIGQLVFDPSKKVMTFSALIKEVIQAGFSLQKVSRLTEFSFVLIAKKDKKILDNM